MMSDLQSQVADAPALAGLLTLLPDLSVLTRSHPDFDTKRGIYNETNITMPLAIVRPRYDDEVCAVLKYCSTNNIPMSIRAGGHDLQGRSLIENGVIVDLRSLNSIEVSNDSKSVSVGPGVLHQHLGKYLDDCNLATPQAWADQVGYIGWATGGGYGMMTGYYGYGVDQILGGRVATASGKIVDTDDDPELLWALRGAGNGNFGAIVELRVKVYPRPKVLAGMLAFPMSEMPSILPRFEEMNEAGGDDLPAAASGETFIGPLPGLGMCFLQQFHWVIDNKFTHGMAMRYKEKLSNLGTLLLDTVAETTPYAFARVQPYPLSEPVIFRAASIAGWTPRLVDLLVKDPVPTGGRILFHHAHNKMLETSSEAAWANRDRHILLGILGKFPGLGDDGKDGGAWAARFSNDIRRAGLSLDKGYWSFTQPEDCDSIKFYGAETVERLEKLKLKYNPGNAFPRAYPVLP